jgi:hypothetical protein
MPYRVALITPRSMLLNFPYGISSSTNTGVEASEVWSSTNLGADLYAPDRTGVHT